MKNKNLAIVLIALVAASCSQASKSTKGESAPAVSAKKESLVVYFDYDKYDLTSDAKDTLEDDILPAVKAAGNAKVRIEGHCDERGSYEYNMGLGKKRADAVKSYLVKNGVKSGNVRTVSFGKTKPVDFGHNESAWEKNRRAVTIIIEKK